MSSIAEIIDRYCDAWNDPDAQRRAQLLAQVCSERASYIDPAVQAAGASELLAHIDKMVARRPGAKVLRTSEVDVHHNVCRFAWHVVLADGTVLRAGIDIAELSADHSRIERVIGFFGELDNLQI